MSAMGNKSETQMTQKDWATDEEGEQENGQEKRQRQEVESKNMTPEDIVYKIKKTGSDKA